MALIYIYRYVNGMRIYTYHILYMISDSNATQGPLPFHMVSGGTVFALQWRHNERDGVSNHQPHDCLFNRLFRRRSKKTSKLCVRGIHRWPVKTSSHKGPVTQKMFPFDDVIIHLLSLFGILSSYSLGFRYRMEQSVNLLIMTVSLFSNTFWYKSFSVWTTHTLRRKNHRPMSCTASFAMVINIFDLHFNCHVRTYATTFLGMSPNRMAQGHHQRPSAHTVLTTKLDTIFQVSLTHNYFQNVFIVEFIKMLMRSGSWRVNSLEIYPACSGFP